MRPVTWYVTDGMLCLTGDGYEDMSRNMADILRWMRDKSAQTEALKALR